MRGVGSLIIPSQTVVMLFGLKEKSSVSGLLTELFSVGMLAAPPSSNLSQQHVSQHLTINLDYIEHAESCCHSTPALNRVSESLLSPTATVFSQYFPVSDSGVMMVEVKHSCGDCWMNVFATLTSASVVSNRQWMTRATREMTLCSSP